MTEPKIDPLLKAAIDRLTEIGPTWHEDDLVRFCDVFLATVRMLYPPKARRKSRAKAAS